jgi:hypothetical protein
MFKWLLNDQRVLGMLPFIPGSGARRKVVECGNAMWHLAASVVRLFDHQDDHRCNHESQDDQCFRDRFDNDD